jgi:AraC-like DNA-binding protein
MVIDQEFGRALAFSFPLVCALVCLTITALDVKRSTHIVRRKIYYKALWAFGIAVVIWCGFVLHSISHLAFVWAIPLLGPVIMVGYVLFYQLTCTITNTGEQTDRPRVSQAVHYIVPAFMAVILLVVMFTVPIEARVESIYGKYRGLLSPWLMIIVLIYSSLYPAMALRELYRYRQKEKAGAVSGHHIAIRRLFWAMGVEMIVMPFPIFGLILGLSPFVDIGLWWFIAVLPSFSVYLVLCKNLLSDNYVIVDPDNPEDQKTPEIELRLSRQRVDQYMETKKPYLNHAFRITDMAEDLFTNRAYMSAFINKEYGMNFNSFVNGYRLRELEKLKEEAAEKKQRVATMQLIMNVGFSNYRSYIRVKNK